MAYRKERQVVFGGVIIGGERVLDDLWSLELKEAKWTRLESDGVSPAPRRSHCATILEHKLYVIGGAPTATLRRPRGAPVAVAVAWTIGVDVDMELEMEHSFEVALGSRRVVAV